MIKLKGTIVSQPLTIKDNEAIIVILLVKNPINGICSEFYHISPVFNYRSVRQFFSTTFSRIALSNIGDEVELEASTLNESKYEIIHFSNLTQGR